MSRVLFLDVDGVLLPGRALCTPHNAPLFEAFRKGTALAQLGDKFAFDSCCVANLQEIVESTGCKLVVISTWRKIFIGSGDRRGILDVLADNGLPKEWF
ncbi:MAG: HAD domain-containing protein, partial [Motiliproteus sp.]|nr:HAD domain-containing protein [Motiliproteus sp.]